MLFPNVCPDEHITFMCHGHHTSVSFPALQAVIQVATWPRGTVERGGRGGGGGEAARFQGGPPGPCRVRGAGGPSDARPVEPDRQGPRAGDGRAAGRGGRRGSAEGGVRGDSAGTAGRRGWGGPRGFPAPCQRRSLFQPPGRPGTRPSRPDGRLTAPGTGAAWAGDQSVVHHRTCCAFRRGPWFALLRAPKPCWLLEPMLVAVGDAAWSPVPPRAAERLPPTRALQVG